MAYNALFMTDVTDKAGAATLLEYDENGNLTKVKDALQHAWTYSYDPNNRNTAITDPLSSVTTLSINSDDYITGARKMRSFGSRVRPALILRSGPSRKHNGAA